MKSASAGNTSRKNLSSLGNELSELSYILVINSANLVLTEDANLLSSVHRTERGTLCIVSIHLNSPLTFPTHVFYIAPAVVSLTQEDRTIFPNKYMLERKISVVWNFFKINAGSAVKRRSAVCLRSISVSSRCLGNRTCSGSLSCRGNK